LSVPPRTSTFRLWSRLWSRLLPSRLAFALKSPCMLAVGGRGAASVAPRQSRWP
jgi:hypothetical protein